MMIEIKQEKGSKTGQGKNEKKLIIIKRAKKHRN